MIWEKDDSWVSGWSAGVDRLAVVGQVEAAGGGAQEVEDLALVAGAPEEGLEVEAARLQGLSQDGGQTRHRGARDPCDGERRIARRDAERLPLGVDAGGRVRHQLDPPGILPRARAGDGGRLDVGEAGEQGGDVGGGVAELDVAGGLPVVAELERPDRAVEPVDLLTGRVGIEVQGVCAAAGR